MDYGFYNPYFGVGMAQNYPQWQGAYNQPMNAQPQGQQMGGMEVIPVQTIQQVEQVSLQPGQRKMVMVQNEPVVAARAADNMGLVTTEYYRLEKFIPGTQAAAPTADYITRQEFNDFVSSLEQTKKTKKEAAE